MSLLCAIQTVPKAGQVAHNLDNHCQWIEKAAGQGAQLVVFPELSLTGYEPELAQELAFVPEDQRLAPLISLAQTHAVTLVVGLPLRLQTAIHIATAICLPDGTVEHYTKHHLHPGEEQYFTPGTHNPTPQVAHHKMAIAICADIAHSSHPENAANSGCSLYAASVFITPKGYEADARLLQGYALQHQLPVLMANFGGPSGGMASAGQSTAWNARGEQLGILPSQGEGMLLVDV